MLQFTHLPVRSRNKDLRRTVATLFLELACRTDRYFRACKNQ